VLANCLAQGEALMAGNHAAGNNLPAHAVVPGNHPGTTILYDQLTPYTLGMLLALYEHRTFVQACIWNINPFDQWGVELGKKIARDIGALLAGEDAHTDHDASTRNLIRHCSRRTSD
jgi:glucose-6-phosphate isomerase